MKDSIQHLSRWFVALIVATVSLAGLALVATSPASAYPVVSCTASITPQTVHPGQHFTVRGHSNISERWTVRFGAETRGFNGPDFSTVFKAPAKPGTYSLTVNCSGANGAQTLALSLRVATAGQHNGGGGGLPNTGGPSLWWWIIASLAVALGTLLLAWRRRDQHRPVGRHSL